MLRCTLETLTAGLVVAGVKDTVEEEGEDERKAGGVWLVGRAGGPPIESSPNQLIT